jgi:hypothetical protein
MMRMGLMMGVGGTVNLTRATEPSAKDAKQVYHDNRAQNRQLSSFKRRAAADFKSEAKSHRVLEQPMVVVLAAEGI